MANKLSVHHAPPLKRPESADEVRLLHRLTVKDEPTASLPRRTDEDWIARHIPLAAGVMWFLSIVIQMKNSTVCCTN
jgi:hypothetical protein